MNYADFDVARRPRRDAFFFDGPAAARSANSRNANSKVISSSVVFFGTEALVTPSVRYMP